MDLEQLGKDKRDKKKRKEKVIKRIALLFHNKDSKKIMQIIKITSKWGKETPTLHAGRTSTRKSGTSNTP
jgi:hypothetical protein